MATESDNVNSGVLGTLLAVLAIATLGIALVVTALVRSEVSEEVEKKDVSADRPFRDLVAEQRSKLDSPAAYIDRTKGLVSLPIDRAMEVTLEGLKKDPTSATPPAPAGGGSGGSAPATASGGTGGAPAEGAAPPAEGKPPEDAKPAEAPKEKSEGEKKKAPPKKPATPAAPTPAAPPPAAPAPAPNGQ